jgi:hypothetical protein
LQGLTCDVQWRETAARLDALFVAAFHGATPIFTTASAFSIFAMLQVLSCRGCSFLSLLSNNITKFPDDFGVHFPNLKCIIVFNP